ncbi:heterokaryon incompatibility protein-domain-containing protein [Xylaria sp. FL0064]|nr:heterokaryon incompatibility protein-domain-containing protein [Xylaria sp. FL0064]
MAGLTDPGNPIYQQLKPNEIRLTRVSPSGHSSATLAVTWKVIDLYRGGTPYTTISYTWGKKEDEILLLLEEEQFRIPCDAYGALKLLCDHEPARQTEWLWIDCMCINQGDDEEKAEQIRMLKDIFELSTFSVVWLGPRKESDSFEFRSRQVLLDTDRGMDFLLELAQQRSTLEDVYNQYNGRRRGTPRKLEDDSRWKDLGLVLRLPWWRRVWTFQEFILPKNVVLWCGRKHISRGALCDATYAMWLCKPDHLLDHESWQPLWERRRVLQHVNRKPSGATSSLLALMSYNGSNGVLDPVDRIYGVLGAVTDDKNLKLVRKLDYCVGIGSTFTSLVKGWIKIHESLDTICYASVFTGGAKTYEERKLPSWVPDWSVPTRPFAVPLIVSQGDNFGPVWSLTSSRRRLKFMASGNNRPRYRFFSDGLRLSCTGVLVDHVDGLASLGDLAYPMVQSRSRLRRDMGGSDKDRLTTSASHILDMAVRCLCLDRGDRYLSKPAPIDDYREEFLYVAHGKQVERGTPEGDSQTWLYENRDFRVQGTRLEYLWKTLGPGRPVAEIDNARETFTSVISDRHNMGLRLTTTVKGNVGMACRDGRTGDMVCILLGCNVPVLLRPRADGTCQLIGECYLQGYMNGELFTEARNFDTDDFVLV